MSRFRGRQRRPRGQSSWYDSSMSALADQEERIEIPPEKVGLVIGRQGRRLKEIREECGVQIFIKDTLAHLRGTAEQVQRAKNMIEEILNTVSTYISCTRERASQFIRTTRLTLGCTQIHTPTVASTRRGVLEPLPRIFDMLQYFETISTSVESL